MSEEPPQRQRCLIKNSSEGLPNPEDATPARVRWRLVTYFVNILWRGRTRAGDRLRVSSLTLTDHCASDLFRREAVPSVQTVRTITCASRTEDRPTPERPR